MRAFTSMNVNAVAYDSNQKPVTVVYSVRMAMCSVHRNKRRPIHEFEDSVVENAERRIKIDEVLPLVSRYTLSDQ